MDQFFERPEFSSLIATSHDKNHRTAKGFKCSGHSINVGSFGVVEKADAADGGDKFEPMREPLKIVQGRLDGL